MADTPDQSHERMCAVCTSDFKTPKILPCGHLLCRECVISWMDTKSDAVCPLCRCPITEPQENLNRSSADIVDALPTDFVMEALVESARLLTKDPVCCACDDVKAEFICMQCLDRMCLSCYKTHNKLSATRHHDVERLSTVTVERLASGRPALCADHGDKQADIFCLDHRLAVCASCIVSKHRGCRSVTELDDEMKSADMSLNKLTDRLLKAEEELKQTIAKLDSRLQELDVSETKDMAQVEETCDRLQELVDNFRNKLNEMSKTSHSKVRSSLHEVKMALGSHLMKVTSQKRAVARAREVAPRPAMIQATKMLTERMKSLDLTTYEAEVWVNPSHGATCCEGLAERLEKELEMLVDQRAETGKKRYIFLNMDGPRPSFLRSMKTLKRERGYKLSISQCGDLVSCEPLEPNILHQLRLEDSKWAGPGVVTYGISRNGQDLYKVRDICKDGCVGGLMLDSSNHLHFYLDGKEIDTETENIPIPCYAIFRFSTRLKVTVFSPIAFLT